VTWPAGSGTAQQFAVRARLPQLASDAQAPTPTGLVLCRITHIVDGDTVDVADCPDAGRIRLILVDTPEVSPGECFGKQASAFTAARLLNREVGLERDITNKDFFGRYLRYVWIEGELFNERLVREGYAALGLYPPDLKYRDRIAAAQADAQANARGLWPICGGLGVPGTPTPKVGAPTSPAATPTPSVPTASRTAPGTCHPASATISSLDKVLETVTVVGSGDLTGWYLVSTRGNQRFNFPPGFELSGSVQIRSGTAAFANSTAQLWWTAATQWNNSEDDDAALNNCAGVQVDYFDDGH
jgi:micrococcal nuclease